jgi:predicted permease
MGRRAGLRRLFRLPTSARTVAREVEDEIRFHLESRAAELERRGLNSAEARRVAEDEFGDVAAARRELTMLGRARVRRWARWAWLDATVQEVRHAARGLRRVPGFTTSVVVMLALGIGVNAAMFGLVDRLLLSAPPHVDADRLVRVLSQFTPEWTGELELSQTMPYADYAAVRDEVPALESVAAYTHPTHSVLGSGLDATELRVMGTTASYFGVLGVRPGFGRFYSADEVGEVRGENVAVLSHGLWRSRFGGDESILGREVVIDNVPYTVIGVAPRGFHGLDLEPVHAWIPISATAQAVGTAEWATVRWLNWVRIVGRLAPDASPAVAAAQATSAYLAAEDYQERFENDPTARIVLGSPIAARAPAVGHGTPQRSGRIALWLLGVSTVVLVIACVNVANLSLARGIRRRRETGVRLAMGIGRRRLAGHVLAETLLIAIMAGVLGLLLAYVGGQLTRVLLMPDLDWAGSPVDGRVLLFAGAAAVVSVFLTGLIPALHAARVDVAALLSGGRGETYRRSRARSGLVVVQATLSVILLVAAGLFVRSLHNARTVPLGYEPDRLVHFTWHTISLDWPAARVFEIYDASLERALGLPTVEAAGLSLTAPCGAPWAADYRSPVGTRCPGRPEWRGSCGTLYRPSISRRWGSASSVAVDSPTPMVRERHR